MVIGMIQPTAARSSSRGRNIHDDLAGYRAHLGYVPEEAQVYTHLSGLEYLQLVGRLRGMPEKLIEHKARSSAPALLPRSRPVLSPSPTTPKA